MHIALAANLICFEIWDIIVKWRDVRNEAQMIFWQNCPWYEVCLPSLHTVVAGFPMKIRNFPSLWSLLNLTTIILIIELDKGNCHCD